MSAASFNKVVSYEMTLYSYSTQLRAVTKDDYIVRALSMPSDYGTVSKAYISQDLYSNPQETVTTTQQNNPLALDLYILSYNSSKIRRY